MVHLRLRPLALAALTAVLALAACGPTSQQRGIGSSGSAGSNKPAFQANDKVVLALLAPQSGANQGAAKVGQALVQAARMGAAELNDRLVELRVYDTSGDPAKGAAQARRAVAEGADILLGPLFSSVTREVAPIAAEADVKVLSFSTDTSAAGGPVWVIGYLPEMEAQRILTYAAARGRRSVGVFHPSTAYGEAALRGAREAQQAGRTQIVGSTAFQPGFAGVEAGAQAFAGTAVGAEAVLIASSGNDLLSAGSFLNFHNFDPSRVQYLGLGQWFSGATLRESSLRGGWFPAPDPDRASAFSDRFASRYGGKPRFVATLGYDAVQIAGQSVKAARQGLADDPFSPQALARPQGFKGAVGVVRLTPDGRNERALAILKVQRGGFDTVDPAPLSFGAGS